MRLEEIKVGDNLFYTDDLDENKATHLFSQLQDASKYPIRQETNNARAQRVLHLLGGSSHDVVGMNDMMQLYCYFDCNREVVYIDYYHITNSYAAAKQ